MGTTLRTRRAGRLALATLVAACALGGAAPTASAGVVVERADVLQAAIVKRVNAVRAARGLPKLYLSRQLKTASTEHAKNMARYGYFSHSWSNGAAFSTWIKWYYPVANYRYWRAGENLYWAAPDATARRVVTAWMNSPGHRANLLGSWRRMGIAAMRVRNPLGVYGGLGRLVLVSAEFGKRS